MKDIRINSWFVYRDTEIDIYMFASLYECVCENMHMMCLCIYLYLYIYVSISHLVPKISYFKNKNQLYLTTLRLLGCATLINRVYELSKSNQDPCREN